MKLKIPQLTPREKEVAKFVRRGFAPKEISWQLKIHRRTVDDFLKKLRQKFSVQTHYELIVATGKTTRGIARVERNA